MPPGLVCLFYLDTPPAVGEGEGGNEKREKQGQHLKLSLLSLLSTDRSANIIQKVVILWVWWCKSALEVGGVGSSNPID